MSFNVGWRAVKLTSLWTAVGFLYSMVIIELCLFVQTIKNDL